MHHCIKRTVKSEVVSTLKTFYSVTTKQSNYCFASISFRSRDIALVCRLLVFVRFVYFCIRPQRNIIKYRYRKKMPSNELSKKR